LIFFTIYIKKLALNLTKTELKELIKDIVQKEIASSKVVDDKEVRKIVKEILVNWYKFFWERRSTWTNQI
jgi:isopropylmalate/homocitrate/citramalate synthase